MFSKASSRYAVAHSDLGSDFRPKKNVVRARKKVSTQAAEVRLFSDFGREIK